MHNVNISPANESDFDAIWEIFQKVTASGDTFIYDNSISKNDAFKIWMEGTNPYVAKHQDKIVGTYVIRPNKIGRGSHVCNAGFMIAPNFQGQGIGRKMGNHALSEAKKLGYLAMQFNIVVSTNKRSISLWQSLGFKILGTVPKAFDHKNIGLVDIHIMHRFL